MKKLFAALLAMMMLLMPVASFAETATLEDTWQNAERVETVVTIHDLNEDLVKALGGDDTIMTAINDLLNALNISTYTQGEEFGVSIGMQGKELIWGAMTQADTAATIASNLLGGTIVIHEEDTENLSDNYMRLMMKQSGMTDEEIEEALKESQEATVAGLDTEEIMESYAKLMERCQEIMQISDVEAMRQILSVDWTKLAEAWANISIETVPVTEQPEGCTTAAYATTVVVTNEQLMALCYELVNGGLEIPFMKEYYTAMKEYTLAVDTGEEISNEEFDEAMNELIESIKEAELLAEDATLVIYSDENGLPLMFQLDAKFANGEYEPIPLTETATMEITDDGVLIVAKATSLETDVTFTIKNNDTTWDICLVAEEDQTVIEFDIVVDKVATDTTETINVTFDVKITQDDYTAGFGLKVLENSRLEDGQATGKTDITICYMGLDIVTITLDTKTCAAVESRIGTDAVDLGKMTFEEFQNWYTDLQTSLQLLPMQIVMSLPDSILMLMMNMGN